MQKTFVSHHGKNWQDVSITAVRDHVWLSRLRFSSLCHSQHVLLGHWHSKPRHNFRMFCIVLFEFSLKNMFRVTIIRYKIVVWKIVVWKTRRDPWLDWDIPWFYPPFSLSYKKGKAVKGVLYSMLGPDLLGLTVAVLNIVGRCFLAVCTIRISGAIGLIVAESGH